MSSEQLNNVETLETPKVSTKIQGRVDINDLLNRVRETKKKENKSNLIFFGLTGSLILIVGIILSL
jgi:hypothetical protein